MLILWEVVMAIKHPAVTRQLQAGTEISRQESTLQFAAAKRIVLRLGEWFAEEVQTPRSAMPSWAVEMKIPLLVHILS